MIFHHPRGRLLKPGLAWLTRKWLGHTIQDRGLGGHDPEEDARACIDLHKAEIKNGLGYGEFRMDYEPIVARVSRSHSRRHGLNGEGACTTIVDHGNPAHGMVRPLLRPPRRPRVRTTRRCLMACLACWTRLNFRLPLMGLVNALGWVTLKASMDVLGNFTGSPENSSSAAEKVNHTDNPQPLPAPDDKDLFSAVVKLNDHLTTLHAALPTHTAFILLSIHLDPHKMSALAAQHEEYQASQNQSAPLQEWVPVRVRSDGVPRTSAGGGVGPTWCRSDPDTSRVVSHLVHHPCVAHEGPFVWHYDKI